MATEAAELITIEKPSPPSIVAELSPLVTQAQAFEVTDLETDTVALQRVKALRSGEKQIEEHFAKAKQAASAAHKAIVASVAALTGPIAAARSIYDRKAADYEAAERRKAEEEQRRLQAEARKQEEERQLLAAIEAEERGEKAESEAILAEPVTAPVVTVAPAVAHVAGVASRTIWGAEVHDIRACLRFLLERDEWIALLEQCKEVLESGLRPLAIAQHEALNIPGVRAVSRGSRR